MNYPSYFYQYSIIFDKRSFGQSKDYFECYIPELHTLVFSQTLSHGNSKNEIRQIHKGRRLEDIRVHIERIQRARLKEIPAAKL